MVTTLLNNGDGFITARTEAIASLALSTIRSSFLHPRLLYR